MADFGLPGKLIGNYALRLGPDGTDDTILALHPGVAVRTDTSGIDTGTWTVASNDENVTLTVTLGEDTWVTFTWFSTDECGYVQGMWGETADDRYVSAIRYHLDLGETWDYATAHDALARERSDA